MSESKSIEIKSKELEPVKEEAKPVEGVERTRSRRVYVPLTDIYESEDRVNVVADLPGVDENSVEITLEKNELTINGYVDPLRFENYDLTYAEYGIGDYHRSFILSNEIDRDKIEASVKDGVLYLELPIATHFKARKIEVKAG